MLNDFTLIDLSPLMLKMFEKTVKGVLLDKISQIQSHFSLPSMQIEALIMPLVPYLLFNCFQHHILVGRLNCADNIDPYLLTY